MRVLGEKRGLVGTLPCQNCNGKTGVLYTIKNGDKYLDICTSCQSVIKMIEKGQGKIITRIWEHKNGEKFTLKT